MTGINNMIWIYLNEFLLDWSKIINSIVIYQPNKISAKTVLCNDCRNQVKPTCMAKNIILSFINNFNSEASEILTIEYAVQANCG